MAVPQPDGSHLLYGQKFFTSAVDANMALTLARPVVSAPGEEEEVIRGTQGLALFYVETRDASAAAHTASSSDTTGSIGSGSGWNGLQVLRLKDKLGTRQLPTAELLLDGCRAYRLSEIGRGVPAIAGMLTITRINNAVSSVAAMRRYIFWCITFQLSLSL